MSTIPVFFEVAILLEVCVLLLWGLPTSHRPRATFLTVLQQRATSYTRWAHMNVTPSLPHSHTRPASNRCSCIGPRAMVFG